MDHRRDARHRRAATDLHQFHGHLRRGSRRAAIAASSTPCRDSAAPIEASDLDWTILRPGRFVRGGPSSRRLTRRGEPFVGDDVSIDALSKLIVDLAMREGLHVRESLGVSRE
ncbi:NAD(P)H-binding protein [Siculibacillus lacustris]|uniref:NAD(P)H-binding protein n=1 Tax=Siculibacillus lacustris TaxID=1549641 RepID=UPI0019D0832D